MNFTEETKQQNHRLDTKTVRLNKSGLRIRYAELGDPAYPTMLLLHGVPENLQGWYAVAPLLAEKYHVLALDLPGFGGSDLLTSPKDYTSLRFAEVIVDFMDSLHINQAVLMATDIALLPSLLVGLEHPSRVSKLAVMDGIPFPRPQYHPGNSRVLPRRAQSAVRPWSAGFRASQPKLPTSKDFAGGTPSQVVTRFLGEEA